MKTIAHIHTDFPQKFGIPRQSGIVEQLEGRIVFEPPFRDPDWIRGISGWSHLWLLWGFQGTERPTLSPTVTPPRLGGKAHMGVFATRSPFRPNPIGLSCVRLIGVEMTSQGPVLVVAGADLRDNTPIYDIKPYVPFADCRPEATSQLIKSQPWQRLDVVFPPQLLDRVPEAKRESLIAVLAEDPRPALQTDPAKIFTMAFAGLDVHFQVVEGTLTVTDVTDCGI
ncbi:MAG: tRNA (N6-threonylcarbamoyladenosine(37)-N6)-methyltransferase TrmO, partial [Eggerthellales bacterium]|nr:tRNA (N6-threonylcarbamoyladenosine(37)-N6)-methyltransferase TrmO [Eggerthellales bacterium]